MGTFDSNALLTTPAYRGIKPDTIVAAEKTQAFGRPGDNGAIHCSRKRDGKNFPGNSTHEAQVTPTDGSVFPRIRELEVELTYYRQKLEDLAQQRTEKLARRISILEACNSNLCESYNHMRQMYLVLLASTQSLEDGTAAAESFE